LDFQSSKQVFYWLQEFKDDKESEELVKKVNNLLQAKDQQQTDVINSLYILNFKLFKAHQKLKKLKNQALWEKML
jgi:hypothetical protein